MSFVYAKPGESIDSLLRRFKRRVESSQILRDYRKHEYYVKPSVAKKEKSAEARKRERKRQQIAEKFYKSNANFKFNYDKSEKIYQNPNKFSRQNNQHSQRPAYQDRQDNRHHSNDRRNANNGSWKNNKFVKNKD